MDKEAVDVLILYGSETGNAEDFARQIFDALKTRIAVDLSEADGIVDFKSILDTKCLIFVVSTSGQGCEPRNFRKFWKFLLRSSLPPTLLHDIHCAVLGLGDSTYQRYNYCGKRLYRRLFQLGCNMLLPLCLANEQDDKGVDTMAIPWIDNIIIKIEEKFKTKSNCKSNYKSEFNIDKIYEVSEDSKIVFPMFENSYKFTVTQNNRISALDHFQQINCIEVSISGDIDCEPGTVLRVFPKNANSQVVATLALLKGILEKQYFDISFKKKELSFKYVSIKEMLFWYFDINSIPRRRFFQTLAERSDHKLEQEKLSELASSINIDDYYSYCCRTRRTCYETLLDFPNTASKLTMADLLDLIPFMKPRDYSLCSYSKTPQSRVAVVVALVKYRTAIKEPRFGTCSRYLCSLKIGDIVNCQLILPEIKFAPIDTPNILISTGTGCASAHVFLQSLPNGFTYSKQLVFLGFRNKYKDFIFSDDWERYSSSKNVEIHVAFSRDQEYKIYVQQKLIEQGESIWKCIQTGAYIIVSGNSKRMPDDVYNAIKGIISIYGSMSDDSASKFMQNLERSGRYQTETY